MQMIEILDNQSGTARRLLKTRHLAHRIYCVIEARRASVRAAVITRLHYVLLRSNLNIAACKREAGEKKTYFRD